MSVNSVKDEFQSGDRNKSIEALKIPSTTPVHIVGLQFRIYGYRYPEFEAEW